MVKCMKIYSYLKPYRMMAALALFLMLAELGVELLQPLLMAKIIDDGIMQENLSVVIKWGSVMVGISIFSFIGGIINSFAASHVSQSFGYDIRSHLFKKLQAFSFTNLTKYPTSSLITRMTNDVTVLQNTVFMAMRIMLRAPLLIILGTVMALLVNWKLALVLLISIPVLILFLTWVMKRASVMFRFVQEKLDNVNGVMQENLMGMRLIKAFLRKEHEASRFNEANDALQKKTASSLRFIEVSTPILLLVMNVGLIIILWLGQKKIATGTVQVGEVVAIVNYATRITSSLSVLSWLIMSISRAQASASRINDVLDTKVDLLDTKEESKGNEIHSGEITFKDVSFRYPTADTDALRNITFTAKAGETIAIMGATGSGKTSLFQLIPRLFDVDQGQITIDGEDITTMKLDILRKKIGFVPQEALLFSGSIQDNIAWGKDDASMAEIITAAKDAQIHETVSALTNQYDTPLGQKGVNLSGGQKQRLAIARALVRKPKILLLDDSTSALDLKTEAKLLNALKTYTCTTLIITQKVSTAKEANQILLLEEGELIAKGPHEQLVASHSLYQQIVLSQMGKEGLTVEKSTSHSS